MLRNNKRCLNDADSLPDAKRQLRSALESSLRKTLRGKMSKQDLKFGFEVLRSWNLETKQAVFKLSHKSFAKLIKPMPNELISVLQQFRSDSQATKQKLYQRQQLLLQNANGTKPAVEKKKKKKPRQTVVVRRDETELELRDTLLEEAEFCFQVPDLASLEPISGLPDFPHSNLKLEIPDLAPNPFGVVDGIMDDQKDMEDEPENPFLEKKKNLPRKSPAKTFLGDPSNPFAQSKIDSDGVPIPSKDLIIKVQSQFSRPLDYRCCEDVLKFYFKEKVKLDDPIHWKLTKKQKELFLEKHQLYKDAYDATSI